MAEKKCENHCPNCGADINHLSYQKFQPDYQNSIITVDGFCRSCKLPFTEEFDIVYKLTTYAPETKPE